MELASILQPGAVRIASDITSKKRLLHAVSDIAAEVTGQPSSLIQTALLERESLGPTGFGAGIALPHARLNDIQSVQGVFLKLERAIDFDSVDRQPVDLVFALLAPEESGTQHLKALALVSRTLRQPGLCEKLRASSDTGAIYSLLAAARTTQAA